MMHDSQHVPTEVRCADAPRELTGLVDSMLAYDRWDRPSMAEVHGDLAWLADALATPVVREPQIVRIRRPRWTPHVVDIPRPQTDGSFERLLGDDATDSEG